jgi:hypothetical protein
MHDGLAPSAVRLLRTGIVPATAIEDLSVGYGLIRSRAYSDLDSFLRGKHQNPVFVNGEWGTGKSHMLNFHRMVATNLGIPTSFVSLNPRTLPLNYPQRLYGEIVASARTDNVAGLRSLLEVVMRHRDSRIKLKHTLVSSSTNSLSPALLSLIDHYDQNDTLNPRLEAAWAYILGEDLGWADYPYKREQALNRIDGLAATIKAVNGAGLLIYFDEAETLDQLWNIQSRTIAYDVMVRIAKMPAVWAVFAITDRFLKIVKEDSLRCGGSAAWISSGLRSGNFPIFIPPRLDRDLALELASCVSAVYSKAYPVFSVSQDKIHRWVEEWGRNPSGNPRRLIRLIVNRLDLLRPLPVLD